MNDKKERARLVEQARRYLESAGRPRLVMLGILTVTLAVGFLASVAMVHLGLTPMHLRYPLSVAVAYVTFLWQLRGWLRRQALGSQLSEDPEGLLLPGSVAFAAAALRGKLAAGEPRRGRRSNDSSRGGHLDVIGDLGNGVGEGLSALSILVLVGAITTMAVSIYLVVTSPLLLAELLVDGALLGAVSRAVGPGQPLYWSRAVVRRTWIAALVTALVFGLVGFGIERVAPGSHTLVEAWALEHPARR